MFVLIGADSLIIKIVVCVKPFPSNLRENAHPSTPINIGGCAFKRKGRFSNCLSDTSLGKKWVKGKQKGTKILSKPVNSIAPKIQVHKLGEEPGSCPGFILF